MGGPSDEGTTNRRMVIPQPLCCHTELPRPVRNAASEAWQGGHAARRARRYNRVRRKAQVELAHVDHQPLHDVGMPAQMGAPQATRPVAWVSVWRNTPECAYSARCSLPAPCSA